MDFLQGLDAVEANMARPRPLVKEGEYVAQITDVEIRNDAAYTMLKAELTITDQSDETGRKIYWTQFLNDKTTVPQKAFIKGQICKMAGTNTTNGDPATTLANTKMNFVKVSVRHNTNPKTGKVKVQPSILEMVTPF